MSLKRTLTAAVAAAVLLGAASGCATIPRDKSAADWLHVLPAGSSYYLCLNTARTRDLAKAALKKTPYYSNDVGQLLNFTDQVYCGIKTGAGKPSFSLVMLGGYPTMLKSILDKSAEWEEIKGEYPYWRHRKFGIQAALPEEYMVLIAQDNVEGLIATERAGGAFDLSRDAQEQIRQNDITILFPLGLDDIVSGELGVALPRRIFEEIWIGARLRGGAYHFSGVFRVGPDVDPASFKKLLQFFFLALLRRNEVADAGKRLADMTFSVEGRMISVEGFSLSEAEVKTLLATMLAKGL